MIVVRSTVPLAAAFLGQWIVGVRPVFVTDSLAFALCFPFAFERALIARIP